MFAALLLSTGVTVSLPETIEVKGTELTVGSIAQVTGQDAALVARVEAASLGYAPAPGYSRLLDGQRVAADLRQLMPSVQFQVTGAPRCRVTPEVVTLTAARLLQEADSALRGALEGEDVRITTSAQLADLQVPAPQEAMELRARLRDGAPRAGAWSVPVEILVDGEVYRTVWTRWEVELWERRHVLRHSVRAGQNLSSADFELVRVPVGSRSAHQALAPAALGDATARRALAKGAVVTDRDVERRVVIARGETIYLEVLRGRLRVRCLATALRDAHVGDHLPVRIQTSGKEFTALVTGPDSVELRLK